MPVYVAAPPSHSQRMLSFSHHMVTLKCFNDKVGAAECQRYTVRGSALGPEFPTQTPLLPHNGGLSDETLGAARLGTFNP